MKRPESRQAAPEPDQSDYDIPPVPNQPEPDPQIIYDPRAWRSMEEAPRDNTLIEAKTYAGDPDDTAVPIKYRVTRRRDHTARRWVVVGFWANAITREELNCEPEVWRLPDGFLTPGMVV